MSQSTETEPDPHLPRFTPLPELHDGNRIARQLADAGYIEAAWFVLRTKNQLINTQSRLADAEEQLERIRRIVVQEPTDD